jgi:GTP cyclohydrolase IA
MKRNRRATPRISDIQRSVNEIVVKHQPALLQGAPFQSWPAFRQLQLSYEEVLKIPAISGSIHEEHLTKTPARVAKALAELLEGYNQDPVKILETSFTSGNYNQMIIVRNIGFVSLCVHHILPFVGRVHFAYIPKDKIVGLSKIPRLVECFSKRLQVQEELSEQIVDAFQKIVGPKGCAISIEGVHSCASIRGVKKEGMIMETNALRGIFETDASAKAEFLASIRKK